MKRFGIILVVICAVFLMTGCTKGPLKIQSPIVMAGQQQQQFQAPVLSAPIIQVIDQFCVDDQFNRGLFDGYYMGRELQIFTGQQLKDINQFREFCKKPKPDRTPYDYGYITGRVADSLIVGLVPYLGRDAIVLLRAAGLLL